jgi:hypothetical protein
LQERPIWPPASAPAASAWVRDAFTSTKTISSRLFHDEIDLADPAAPAPVAQPVPRPQIGAFHLLLRRRAAR